MFMFVPCPCVCSHYRHEYIEITEQKHSKKNNCIPLLALQSNQNQAKTRLS